MFAEAVVGDRGAAIMMAATRMGDAALAAAAVAEAVAARRRTRTSGG